MVNYSLINHGNTRHNSNTEAFTIRCNSFYEKQFCYSVFQTCSYMYIIRYKYWYLKQSYDPALTEALKALG